VGEDPAKAFDEEEQGQRSGGLAVSVCVPCLKSMKRCPRAGNAVS
jgi:hypothetical protein